MRKPRSAKSVLLGPELLFYKIWELIEVIGFDIIRFDRIRFLKINCYFRMENKVSHVNVANATVVISWVYYIIW